MTRAEVRSGGTIVLGGRCAYPPNYNINNNRVRILTKCIILQKGLVL